MSDANDPEAWITYRRHVVETLKELSEGYKELHKEIITIKIKMAVWGALGGGGGAALVTGVLKLIEHLNKP